MRAMNRHRVLVLNKLWTAVGIATLERAITKLCQNYSDGTPKAQIVTPPPVGQYETFTWNDWAQLRPVEGEDVIISPSKLFKVPDVVVLTRYDGDPQHKVHFSRKHIWKRDNYRCQYCGVHPPSDELTLDHVAPRSQGGETTWTNCVLACYQCNSQKADRRPEEATKGCIPKDRRHLWRGSSPMKLLALPKKPQFSLFKGERVRIPETWKHWVDKVYWEMPLQNDMPDDVDDSFIDDV
jgi:5-methylcytosine-specific restriction endonuclease McrA